MAPSFRSCNSPTPSIAKYRRQYGGSLITARLAMEFLTADEPVHIDDMVERSGLNSSEVLATLFDLAMKGVIRQLPGKQYKVLL
jgi:predicted Rossmann fold nucleotide-binding protein DprA/Smf involved in DNA uptake